MRFFPAGMTEALAAVVHIARHEGSEHPVQARPLNHALGLPPRHLEPLLQRLCAAGILVGRRGPRGGYRLARSPHSLFVASVLTAIASPEEAAEPRHPDMVVLDHLLMRTLRPITIDQLSRWLEVMRKTSHAA